MPISEVYNEDCIAGLNRYTDKFFDLAIVDPEYGRGEDGGKNRGKNVRQKNGTATFVPSGTYENKEWDKAPAGPKYFAELIRVSKHQIIWGCNYYPQYFGPGRIIWDKCNDGSDQSQCEIAYNSLTSRVDLCRYMWRGMMQGKSISEGYIQQGNKKLNEKRIHPTQKPVVLYKWLLQKFAQPGWNILDTHLGSGSSRIAAYELGFDFYGWEVDKDYYKDQEDRFNDSIKQFSIFT